MTITSAIFFGTGFIVFGLITIYRKRITLTFGETEQSPKKQYRGTSAILMGMILIIIGIAILNSDTFSQYTILSIN